jgi:alpha-D-xyloside xylohydrolase
MYSLAAKTTMDNYTIMRALTFDFRNDVNVYNIPDQYMFGPAFLVSPVTEQLYTGAKATAVKKSRKLYLPQSAAWYNFWTGEVLNGGQTIDAEAPIDIIPLYIKAGSIVPMGANVEYATEKPGSDIELRIYPGANGEFKFYEDENDNYNYEKGSYSTFNIKWDDKLHQLSIADRKGGFPGMQKRHRFNIVLVKKAHGVSINETDKPNKSIVYTGNPVIVKL